MKTFLIIVAIIFFGCAIYFDISAGVYGRYNHSPLGGLFFMFAIISLLLRHLIDMVDKSSDDKKP